MTHAARNFMAILYKEDDWYVAECPEVGTASQGVTPVEALSNLKKATELFLEDFPLPGVTSPVEVAFEVKTFAKDGIQ